MARHNAPAPAITGDVLRVTAVVNAENQTLEMSSDFMLQAFDTNIITDIFLLAIPLAANVAGQAIPSLPSSATLVQINVACVSRNDVPTVVIPENSVGTGVATHLPLLMTAVLQKNSLLKGQHGRGRIEWGPVPANWTTPAVNPNILNATGLGILNTLGGAFTNPVTAAGQTANPCISTRPIAPAFLVTKAIPILQANARALLGTQRRRYIGRGI